MSSNSVTELLMLSGSILQVQYELLPVSELFRCGKVSERVHRIRDAGWQLRDD